eukprot:963728-Pyramimonas_sp.AAC.1
MAEQELQLYDRTRGTIRVMSPRPNEGLLQGVRLRCGRCAVAVDEPALCTQCGIVGHPTCLNLEYFQGYPFCGTCTSHVIQQYAAYDDGLRRE